MTEQDFKKQIYESMRSQNQIKKIIPEHDSILGTLHRLEDMPVAQVDRLFCASFLSEGVKLLINSVFLYEEGYFDCAFYCIRQAAETCNNMLYIANKGKDELQKWNQKEYFPMNQKLLHQLSKIDTFYREVKDVIPDFFEEHSNLMKKSHKIIHKQGFDTFYGLRNVLVSYGEFNQEEELQLFLDFLNKTICMIILLYIIVEPISLILADEDLSVRLNFDPMAESADIAFLQKNISPDILAKIESTPFFAEIGQIIKEKEKMTDALFDVIRCQYFDLEHLDDIRTQSHLLNLNEKIILELLSKGIKISNIYPDCTMTGYSTSIRSNYQPESWSSADFDVYRNSKKCFNLSYDSIFRSVIKGPDSNWLLEHNKPLEKEEIENVREIFKAYNTAYQELCLNIQN